MTNVDQLTPSQFSWLLSKAPDGAEFSFHTWSLIVMDYEGESRQIKVCPDAERPDFGAFWLDVDTHLESELEELVNSATDSSN